MQYSVDATPGDGPHTRRLLRYTSRLPLHTVGRPVSTYGSATCGVSSQGKVPTGEACNSQARHSKRAGSADSSRLNDVLRAWDPTYTEESRKSRPGPQPASHCTLAYCLQRPERVGRCSLRGAGNQPGTTTSALSRGGLVLDLQEQRNRYRSEESATGKSQRGGEDCISGPVYYPPLSG